MQVHGQILRDRRSPANVGSPPYVLPELTLPTFRHLRTRATRAAIGTTDPSQDRVAWSWAISSWCRMTSSTMNARNFSAKTGSRSASCAQLPQSRDLLLLAARVRRRHTARGLEHPDLLGRLEPLGQQVDQRGVDVVDAAAQPRELGRDGDGEVAHERDPRPVAHRGHRVRQALFSRGGRFSRGVSRGTSVGFTFSRTTSRGDHARGPRRRGWARRT